MNYVLFNGQQGTKLAFVKNVICGEKCEMIAISDQWLRWPRALRRYQLASSSPCKPLFDHRLVSRWDFDPGRLDGDPAPSTLRDSELDLNSLTYLHWCSDTLTNESSDTNLNELLARLRSFSYYVCKFSTHALLM